jgi:hypothetical protein
MSDLPPTTSSSSSSMPISHPPFFILSLTFSVFRC